jgi:hypothetical protein
MQLVPRSPADPRTDDSATQPKPVIFGLRYLEDEEAEIHDVVGCASGRTCSDDHIVAFA